MPKKKELGDKRITRTTLLTKTEMKLMEERRHSAGLALELAAAQDIIGHLRETVADLQNRLASKQAIDDSIMKDFFKKLEEIQKEEGLT